MPESFDTTTTITVTAYPDGRVDTANAARYLGVSPKTLAMWRTDGSGPKFVKRIGRVYYYLGDLDGWLNERGRVNSTSQLRP